MGTDRHTLLFPLGCPVELRVEDAGLAKSAAELWATPEITFDWPPLRLDVILGSESKDPLAFVARSDGFCFHAGANHGSFDLARKRGSITTCLAMAPLLFESVTLTALTWTRLFPIHAGCVTRDGFSILLCGDSHAGKSTLSYECAKAGWTYVSDNSLYLEPRSRTLISGSPSIKLRGSGAPLNPKDEGLAQVRTACPGPVVFLARGPGPTRLELFEPDGALRYFMRYSTRPDAATAENQYRGLLERGVWRAHYSEAADAVRLLDQLRCAS